MSNFSFEAVHEYLARKSIEAGLPKDTEFEPAIILVRTERGEVRDALPMPGAHVFFTSSKGKDLLGKFLREIIPTLPADACLAVVAEAYKLTIRSDIKEGDDMATLRERHNVPPSLKDAPEAEEVISISLYRPGKHRIGYLPIGADRTLTYQPLDDDSTLRRAQGRLVPESTQAPRGAGAKHSIFADAREMQRMSPTTFEAPTREDLDALRVGMSVKLCAAEKERFWVKVATLDGDKVTGTIAPPLSPTNKHCLREGDKVSFELRHIFRVE